MVLEEEVARTEPEEYARIRSAVESGRIPCGGPQHLKIIQYDINMRDKLSPRDRRIIKMSIQGWTTVAIAESVGLGRARVDQIISEFFR